MANSETIFNSSTSGSYNPVTDEGSHRQPSSVDKALGISKALQDPLLPGPQNDYKTIQLTPEEYATLHSEIERHLTFHSYINDKVRWDYDPSTTRHHIRLPGPVQSDADRPGVLLEVSHSTDGKNLQNLACDYIIHSNRNIKVVIGIDMGYGGTKESTVSLWRPVYVHEDGKELDLLNVQMETDHQPFRAPDRSSINQTEKIRLDLSDFTPEEPSAKFRGTQLDISYRPLSSILDEIEIEEKYRKYRKRNP